MNEQAEMGEEDGEVSEEAEAIMMMLSPDQLRFMNQHGRAATDEMEAMLVKLTGINTEEGGSSTRPAAAVEPSVEYAEEEV